MILQEQHAYAWLKQKGQWLSQQLARLLDDNKQKNTIASLDGVRAIACLTVLTFHISLMARETHILKLLEPYSSAVVLAGGSGVTLFFVLSGFLLFLPYAKALLSSSTWPSARLFYIRRIFRIVPAYYASLFLLILLFPENRHYLQLQHLKEVVLFLLFFMDSTKQTFQAINGPFWTLAVEWQYYLLLPLLTLGIAFVARRGTLQHRFWKIVLCLLALIAWGCFSRYWGVYFTTHPTQTFLIRRSQLNIVIFFAYGRNGKYLEDFSIGMLISLCYVFAQYVSAEFKARFMTIMDRLSPWLFGTGIALLYFMAMWHFNQWYYHRWPFYNNLASVYDIFNEFGFSLGFGLCITAILFGPARLKHFFEWTPLRWIGLISYSLYMWHLPLLLVFRLHVGYNVPSLNPFLAYSLYWLWALLVIIPFSFLFYIWIEKPWIQVGARFLSFNTHQPKKKE